MSNNLKTKNIEACIKELSVLSKLRIDATVELAALKERHAKDTERIAELEKQLRDAKSKCDSMLELAYGLGQQNAIKLRTNERIYHTYAEARAAQGDDYVEYCKTQPAAPVEDFESPAAQEQEESK